MKHAEHEHGALSQDRKVNALLTGLGRLVHTGELTAEGLVAVAPVLGMPEGSDFIFVHNELRHPDGIGRLEEHYATLNSEGRRAIGRAINEVRFGEVQQGES